MPNDYSCPGWTKKEDGSYGECGFLMETPPVGREVRCPKCGHTILRLGPLGFWPMVDVD